MKVIDVRGKVPVAVATSKQGSITFRRAVDRDRGAISRLILQEKLNPLFLDPKNFVVASEENEVVGCAQLRGIPFSGTVRGEMELSSVVVKEGFRSRGIGSNLIQILLFQQDGKMAPRNADVFLMTTSNREGFYSRFGFKRVVENEQIPMLLRVEKLLGTPIANAVAGQALLVMTNRS